MQIVIRVSELQPYLIFPVGDKSTLIDYSLSETDLSDVESAQGLIANEVSKGKYPRQAWVILRMIAGFISLVLKWYFISTSQNSLDLEEIKKG